MAIKFAVRGTSLSALYSTFGQPAPLLFGTNVAVVSAAETGLIGSSYIDLQNSTNAAHAVFYPGFSNFSTNQAFSILLRLKVVATTGTVSLFSASAGSFIGSVEMWLASGNLSGEWDTEAGNASWTASGAWAPSSSVYYDLVLTSTGDTTTNGTKVYIDNSLLFQATPTTPYPNPRIVLPTQIALGYAGNGLTTSRIKVNEFVIWDSVINPGSVTLTTGSGALNGASRSAFVAANSFGSPLQYSRGRIVNK
jgi:hypothetical protein